MFDFSKYQEIVSLDVVPEDYRGLYVEKDGKFKLESDHPGVKSSIAAIQRINQALVKARADRQAALDRANAFDLTELADYGEDVPSIKSAFETRLKEASKGKGPADLDAHLARQKKELETQFASTLNGEQTRNKALTSQLHNMLVVNGATAALVTAKAIDAELAMPHVIAQVKVDEEDGKMVAKVVDGAGEIRYSGTTGQPMTITELVSEMKGKDKFKPLFQSEAKGGGGAERKGPVRPQGQDQGDMSAAQKIAAGLDQRGVKST